MALAHQIEVEGPVAVLLEEVVQAETELLKYHAHMTSIVEPLQQTHTVKTSLYVILVKGIQDFQLQSKCFENGIPSVENYLKHEVSAALDMQDRQWLAGHNCTMA